MSNVTYNKRVTSPKIAIHLIAIERCLHMTRMISALLYILVNGLDCLDSRLCPNNSNELYQRRDIGSCPKTQEHKLNYIQLKTQ